MGFTFGCDRRLLDYSTHWYKLLLCGGVATFIGIRFGNFPSWADEALSCLNGLFWITGLVGWSRTLFVRRPAWLNYCTEAVYPFYIIHQTIIVGIMFVIVGEAWPWWVKWVLTSVGTFAGCYLLYEFAVKRIGLLRAPARNFARQLYFPLNQ